MKTILLLIKYTFLVIGTIFILSAIIILLFDNANGGWMSSIGLLFFGVPVFFIGKAIKLDKPTYNKQIVNTTIQNTSKTQTIATISIDEQAFAERFNKSQQEKQQQIKDYRYIKEFVQGKIYQALESIEIIESTKNIDTLESRFHFLQQIWNELKLASHTTRYTTDVQASLDHYKQMYYDKTPTKIQLTALLKPTDFDIYSFYGNSIYDCFIKHYNTQIEEIEKLKTENGKKGRYKKLYESVIKAKELMYEDCVGIDNFSDLYQKLEEKEYQLEDFL